MKKFTFAWAYIAVMVVLMLFVVAVAFGQDTSRATIYCVCDSAFVRRVNYRIDRQLDWNHTVWSELHDQKSVNAQLESRMDSLRAIVRAWAEREQAKKRKK